MVSVESVDDTLDEHDEYVQASVRGGERKKKEEKKKVLVRREKFSN